MPSATALQKFERVMEAALEAAGFTEATEDVDYTFEDPDSLEAECRQIEHMYVPPVVPHEPDMEAIRAKLSRPSTTNTGVSAMSTVTNLHPLSYNQAAHNADPEAAMGAKASHNALCKERTSVPMSEVVANDIPELLNVSILNALASFKSIADRERALVEPKMHVLSNRIFMMAYDVLKTFDPEQLADPAKFVELIVYAGGDGLFCPDQINEETIAISTFRVLKRFTQAVVREFAAWCYLPKDTIVKNAAGEVVFHKPAEISEKIAVGEELHFRTEVEHTITSWFDKVANNPLTLLSIQLATTHAPQTTSYDARGVRQTSREVIFFSHGETAPRQINGEWSARVPLNWSQLIQGADETLRARDPSIAQTRSNPFRR